AARPCAARRRLRRRVLPRRGTDRAAPAGAPGDSCALDRPGGGAEAGVADRPRQPPTYRRGLIRLWRCHGGSARGHRPQPNAEIGDESDETGASGGTLTPAMILTT